MRFDTSEGENSIHLIYIGSEIMLMYYVMLILGVFIVIGTAYSFIVMFVEKEYPLATVAKSLGAFLLGGLLLWITLPSLKYIVLKQYDVVSGQCIIEIDSSSRSSTADFEMLDTDEIFSFSDIPTLDAYGKAIPYYCKVTVTKDHMFEINYKIYNVKTRKLILTGK